MYLNNIEKTLDTAPKIIGGRTMLPIRFIAESFGFNVDWNEDNQTINISIDKDTSEISTEAVTEEIVKEADLSSKQNLGNKILIAYFSRANENYGIGYIEKGNTAEIADFIAENIDADIFEIKPTIPYPKEYKLTTEIAQKEFDENAMPEFIGEIENIEQYGTIFLGYPIWWGKMPRIMNTFLEKYNLSGKTIIAFSTHEGSGWGSSISQLEELCTNSDIVEGFSIKGTNAKNSSQSVKSWIEELDLK